MALFSRLSVLALCSRVLTVQSDCGWTSTCGPRGCPDCKDDGSAGYRECCGSGPSPSPSGNCGWTKTCGPRGCPDCKDDGSAGFRQCCGSGPSPTPPGPPSPPGPSGHATYCPNPGQDFNVDYGIPQFIGTGWNIHGGGRVSSKASFNFAGGFVEFDMDLGGAHGGVNNNAYITFPRDGHTYCDSGPAGGCAEFDFTENNGNCFQSTTWHHDRGGGDKGGQAGTGGIGSQIHVKASWSADGKSADVQVGGNHYSGEGYQDVMSQFGGVIYSSQWTGWVPGNCGGDGNLGASSFSVSNVRVQGKVVQGPEPNKCAPSPGPPSPPSPPSPPGPPSPPSPPSPPATCSGYCSTTGCGWTEDYSCPWAPAPGAKGRAGDDGSVGYRCCFGKRTAEDQPCGGVPPSPTPKPPPPSPTPPSPPSPTPPSPPGCPGGSLSACIKLCPSDPAAYQACVKECTDRCSSEVVV